MGAVLGLSCKFYRNANTYASPSWNECPNVKTLTLNLEDAEADVTTRGNNGWRATIGALRDAGIEFDMVWDPADTDFQAFRDAYLNRTDIEILALDGAVATAGSQGLRATCRVTGFTREEPLEEAVMARVRIKPAYAANPPAWYTAA